MVYNYVDRNISWMDFNDRVLCRATNKNIPLIERAMFLGITQSNINEFISVKYAELVTKSKNKCKELDDYKRNNYKEQRKEVAIKLAEQKRNIEHVATIILSELNKNGINILSYEKLNPSVIPEEAYFINRALTPITYNKSAKSVPMFKDNEINIIYNRTDNETGKSDFVLIRVPKKLGRLYKLSKNKYCFIEDLIKFFIMEDNKINENNVTIDDFVTFKIYKKYDQEIVHDENKSIVDRIEQVIAKRYAASVCYLDCSAVNHVSASIRFLKKLFKLTARDIYISTTPCDLSVFASKPIEKKSMEYPKVKARYVKHDFFKELKNDDIILHHPYDDYKAVLDFINQAAYDVDVVSIRQTLYRVSSDSSPVVNALCRAARNGKEVTVMLEVLARFDEERNISLISKLKRAGVNIIYSLEKYKTHGKMCVVTRYHKKEIELYAHIGTGNYNEKSANIYTDFSLFTHERVICDDLITIFNKLSSGTKDTPNYIKMSPITLAPTIIKFFDKAIENAKNDINSDIIIKVNSLGDIGMADKIIEALEAGVGVFLICRGICILPVKELSEKYKSHFVYKSIIGRYLEHSRVYAFINGSEEKVFISSADLLPRNLYRRIELLTPIYSSKVRKFINQSLNEFILDDTNSIFSKDENMPKGIYDSHKRLYNIKVE